MTQSNVREALASDEEDMHRHTVLIMLAALPLLYAAKTGAAAENGAWHEDQRRCMIYLPIKGGRIAIADDFPRQRDSAYLARLKR